MRFANWVVGFCEDMLIPAVLALGTLWLCRPWRKKRLAAKGLETTGGHELALAVFVAFCAGLAALTLFPFGFWSLTHFRYSSPGTFFNGYISWDRIVERLGWLDEMLTPFQEIRRSFRVGGGWDLFLLAGNIAMFMPIGFFPGCCGGVGAGGSPCWRGSAFPLPLSLCSFSLAAAPTSTT